GSIASQAPFRPCVRSPFSSIQLHPLGSGAQAATSRSSLELSASTTTSSARSAVSSLVRASDGGGGRWGDFAGGGGGESGGCRHRYRHRPPAGGAGSPQ